MKAIYYQSLKRQHINVRGYLSHVISETTKYFIRGDSYSYNDSMGEQGLKERAEWLLKTKQPLTEPARLLSKPILLIFH